MFAHGRINALFEFGFPKNIQCLDMRNAMCHYIIQSTQSAWLEILKYPLLGSSLLRKRSNYRYYLTLQFCTPNTANDRGLTLNRDSSLLYKGVLDSHRIHGFDEMVFLLATACGRLSRCQSERPHPGTKRRVMTGPGGGVSEARSCDSNK